MRSAGTLFWGTANPRGEDSSYDGLYLRRSEIAELVLDRALVGLPVKVEHAGEDVGRVLSAWQHDGRLDMLIELGGEHSATPDSCVAQQFVSSKVCQELSLGYSVDMQHSQCQGLRTGQKRLTEVSIVKVGARDRCLIYNFLQPQP
jgi:hypothetical protein